MTSMNTQRRMRILPLTKRHNTLNLGEDPSMTIMMIWILRDPTITLIPMEQTLLQRGRMMVQRMRMMVSMFHPCMFT
jgi:hypothetical protein